MHDRFEAYGEALSQGHLAAQRNKLKDALRHYQAAARLADERAQPHVNIGGVLLRMGKPKDAVAAFERAAQRAPDDPDVLGVLADALFAAGRRVEADELRARVARLADEAANRELVEAEQAGILPRAEVLYVTGQRARAGGRIETAIDAWLDEARSHADSGHLLAALDACQQALTVGAGAARIHLQMADLYFRLGWRELGVERLLLLDRLLELASEDDERHQFRALVARNAAADGRLAAIAARPAPG